MNRLAQPLAQSLDRDHGDWQPLLDAWRRSAEGRALIAAVDARVAAGVAVYPAQPFRAFELTPLAATRVMILGQDPYHGAGQAEGLAFSVPAGCALPPSLRNIFKERQRDLGLPPPAGGSLLRWAQRGVLLLNTSLTVEEGLPGSHASLGWQALTGAVCRALAADPAPKVFMLWGAQAQGWRPLVGSGAGHRVLACNHPSPLAATRPPQPFIGSRPFSQANAFLAGAGRGEVDWGT